MTNFCFFFVISFRLLLSLYSSSYVFFRAALKVERNNSKVHEPQAKVELSGLKKREYMTFSRLISTACDLQGGCWSIHFEYIYFSLYRAKIMCSRHENTKSTFTLLRTACEGGLPNYCCFYSCCCFYLFCFVLFYSLFWCDNFVFIYLCIFFFVQTSTNVFAGYTNAALVRFATIPKVHAIAHANMDSREMDENVKVVVRSINKYVVKK